MEKQELFSNEEVYEDILQESVSSFGNDAKAVVKFINLSDILPNPEVPPKIYKTEELARLALDILENGLKEPITVVSGMYRGKERYQIVSGEKRFRACLLARVERIPCITIYPQRNISPYEEMMMPPRNYFEEARIFAEAIDRGLYSEEEIAEKAQMSAAEVRAIIALLIFKPEEQQLLLDTGVPCMIAKKLALMNDHTRKGFLETIVCGTNISAVCAKINEIFPDIENHSQRIKFAIKETGFFFNSVNHAVEKMREGGVDISCQTQETDINTIVTLTVPKNKNIPRGI